jgi:catechol-2,3-dioxygenase
MLQRSTEATIADRIMIAETVWSIRPSRGSRQGIAHRLKVIKYAAMKTPLLLLALAALIPAPASAQLAPPNTAGAAIGHVHINATDVDVQSRFWKTVGGTIVQREKLTMVQFPGIYVLLRKQDPTGGTVGSTINHFGFYVKDFAGSVAKWKAAGLTWEQGNNPQVGQGFLTGPDNVRIEIYENTSIPNPIQMHHIHLQIPDPLEAQKWYVQNFGAVAGKRGQFETASVPGTEIALSKVDTPQVPTKGRSVDHMGFEVKNIDAFVAKLQAAGIKTDAAIRNSANASGLRIVYITDPWGTEIEITEGMATTPIATP